MTFLAGLVDFQRPWPSRMSPLHFNGLAKDTFGPASIWENQWACLVHSQRHIALAGRPDQQPLTNAEQSVVLAFDGRLDDRPGLSAALGLPTIDDSYSDSRLALLAYERWGSRAAEYLIGDFAIAVLEAHTPKLWLAVAPKGFRILYFHKKGSLFAFSTSVPWLLALPGISRVLDEHAIADFLAVNHDDSEQTYFRDIIRVCPGTSLTLSASGQVAVTRTWEPNRKPALLLRDDREYVEAAREVLDRVIASHLQCSGEVAIMGSGGLDTSCIAVSAAKLSGTRGIRLITMRPEENAAIPVYPHAYTDEAPFVSTLTDAVPGLKPEFVQPLQHTDLETEPEHVFKASGLMIRNVMQIAWLEGAWRHLAQTGAQAFVDGSNGNFTLTWDGMRGLSDMFWHGNWLSLARYAIARGRHQPRSALRDLWHQVVKPAVPYAMRSTRWRSNSSLRHDAAETYGVVKRMRESKNDPSWIGERSSLNDRILRINRNRVFFAEYHSWMSEKYGVEPRFPLMDVRLIDFCLSVPPRVYVRMGRRRALARDLLLAAGLPPPFCERDIRGRMCPEWFTRLERRRGQIEADIKLIRTIPLAAKMIDFERIDRIMADWPANPEAARPRSLELDILLNRALHVGAFIRWAETTASAPSVAVA